MSIEGWKYYNHAAIPMTAPHEVPDLSPIRNGSIWRIRKDTPLLVRWTEDFDCGHETNWWYIIKDMPFDLNELKAKRRYEINKGLKNFNVQKINEPVKYAQEIFEIVADAYEDYPEAYKPVINRESFLHDVPNWKGYNLYGAFTNDTNKLVAFARLKPEVGYSNFEMMKAMRSYEKYGVNAALIYGMLEDYREQLKDGYYICDGARSINHETSFQDYLEKYFMFRKAYCTLKIEYSSKIKPWVNLLYPARQILSKMDKVSLIHNVNSILRMEEIVRQE